MGSCGLCRSKIGTPIEKKTKNITTEKIKTIDLWIENIEGPYDTIDLPSKPPNKPIILTNKEEIDEIHRNQNMNNSCISINSMSVRNQ
jgi:hypothetical protein